MDKTSAYGKLQPYAPPSWTNDLKNVPTARVPLAMTPTPIHEWKLPGIPHTYQVFVKRDDMTGSTLSGNKVRKMEFMFGHMLQHGCKHVVAVGKMQSNHCRAAAVIAAQLGIKCHLLLAGDVNEVQRTSKGNLFISRMCDADIYVLPTDMTIEDAVPKQRALEKEIAEKTGEKVYTMYVGKFDMVGFFGYIQAWEEMMEQGVQENFHDVVVVCGGGGTLAALAIGNYLTGQKLKVHGISISFTAQYFHDRINEAIALLGLDGVRSEEIVDVIMGYKGSGYGIFTEDDLTLYKSVAAETGILCDAAYVGKGVKGLISELNSNPSRFQGNRVLFVHTGGIFGMYSGKMFDIFSIDKVHDWSH